MIEEDSIDLVVQVFKCHHQCLVSSSLHFSFNSLIVLVMDQVVQVKFMVLCRIQLRWSVPGL